MKEKKNWIKGQNKQQQKNNKNKMTKTQKTDCPFTWEVIILFNLHNDAITWRFCVYKLGIY